MTRDQILKLKVGDLIQISHDTSWCKLLPNARWSPPKKVVEIYAQAGSQHHGKAYVCGYVDFGETARISFSCDESEEGYRLLSDAPTDQLKADYLAWKDYYNSRNDLSEFSWAGIFAYEKELIARNALLPAFCNED